ncbi:MAG: 2-oxo acid dehydrogenase subunit E2 [Chloroflexota bacterium]
MSVDYQLPVLPFGSSEITIVHWLQQSGTPFVTGDPLLIVVNDQVEVALPAPTNGKLEDILINEGETTTAGTVVARLTPTQEIVSTPPQIAPPASSPSILDTRWSITPAAQRIATTLNVDLAQIVGTGPSGRIMKRDVLAVNGQVQSAQQTVEQPQQSVQSSPVATSLGPPVFAPVVSQIPYAVTAMEVDLRTVTTYLTTHAQRFSRRRLELSYTSCIGQALVLALLQYPLLNSRWMDDQILLRKRIHLAVGHSFTDASSTMPVVQDAQDLNLKGLSRAFTQRAKQTHNSVSSTTDLQDHTFTLFSSDTTATWFSVPLPYRQHGNMLHIGQVQTRPWVMNHTSDDRIVTIPTALLTLVYDMRTLDLREGDRFLSCVKHHIEHFTA